MDSDCSLADLLDAFEDGLPLLRPDDVAKQAAEKADVLAFGSIGQEGIGVGHVAGKRADQATGSASSASTAPARSRGSGDWVAKRDVRKAAQRAVRSRHRLR